MKSPPPLTIEEVAQILKVSKYTLYELIKKEEIPAQRIGRQLRIEPESPFHSQSSSPVSAAAPESADNFNPESTSRAENPGLHNLVFIGSHEPIVELFADFWKHAATPLGLRIQFKGSMEGLISLYHNQAQVSGIHLWDEQTQDYNLPFVHYVLPGESITLVNLVQRVQGFIVQPGNPWGLHSWEDLIRPGLRFINRQKGSGTRLRLDSSLQKAKISPAEIQGYTQEVTTHLDIASSVANDQADVGIGIQSTAHRMGLDFIPLFHERYDLVFLHEKIPAEAWQKILMILNAPAFHKAIERQVGYDTSLTGKILYHRI